MVIAITDAASNGPILTVLTLFVTTMIALSLAVERVVEILKGFIHAWIFVPAEPDNPAKESRRCAALHVLSGLIGGTLALVGGIDIVQLVNPSSVIRTVSWSNFILAGLLSSFGSAFWNHVLDILKASKVRQESAAKAAGLHVLKNTDGGFYLG